MKRLLAVTFLGLFFAGDVYAGEILEEAARVSGEFGRKDIKLAEEAQAGGIYKLPSISVKNTGTNEERFQVDIVFLGSEGEGSGVSWLNVEPWRITLDAGEEADVKLGLKVPAGARAGEYNYHLELRRVLEDGKAHPNPMDTADIRFNVEEGSFFSAVKRRVSSYFSANPTMSLVVAGILIVIAISFLW
ncbi:MAG: hypothetical protein U9M98_00250 [Patescibacteria group bacterium]|nr:hypothetical protein [Patescibacteria group bacterium]